MEKDYSHIGANFVVGGVIGISTKLECNDGHYLDNPDDAMNLSSCATSSSLPGTTNGQLLSFRGNYGSVGFQLYSYAGNLYYRGRWYGNGWGAWKKVTLESL